jgi:hypothetical protein
MQTRSVAIALAVLTIVAVVVVIVLACVHTRAAPDAPPPPTVLPPQPAPTYPLDNGYTWTDDGTWPASRFRYRYICLWANVCGPWSPWSQPPGSEANGGFARSTMFANPVLYGSRLPTGWVAQWQAQEPGRDPDAPRLVTDCDNSFIDAPEPRAADVKEPETVDMQPSAPAFSAMRAALRDLETGAATFQEPGAWPLVTMYRYAVAGEWSEWSTNFYSEQFQWPLFDVPACADAVQRCVDWHVDVMGAPVFIMDVIDGLRARTSPPPLFEWPRVCDVALTFQGSVAEFNSLLAAEPAAMATLGFVVARDRHSYGDTIVAECAPDFFVETIPLAVVDERTPGVWTLADRTPLPSRSSNRRVLR